MRITNTMRRIILIVFIVFAAGILGLSIGLYAAYGAGAQGLLEESITSQLNFTAVSSVYEVDGQKMKDSYKSLDDYFDGSPDDYYKDGEFTGSLSDLTQDYQDTVMLLREICEEAGVDYIYTVTKLDDGKYYLIYDTDDEDEEPFCEYEDFADAKPLYEAYTTGKAVVGVMNMEDEWGSYSTGAVPIFGADGKTVVGVLGVDIHDGLLKASQDQFTTGIITLSLVLTAIMIIFGFMLMLLLNHIRNIQNNLHKMAHYDKLTDLPNRRYLLQQLEEMTMSKPKEPFALYFIDLDNFKKVNDNAGHDAGDELLRSIAEYLQSVHKNSKVFRMGAGSVNVTARVGGDEFIIIAPGVDTEEAAGQFAQEILDGFVTEKIKKFIDKFEVGLSIGVALYPEQITSFHTLINYADTAMYYAKKDGKSRYRIYNDDMYAGVSGTELRND